MKPARAQTLAPAVGQYRNEVDERHRFGLRTEADQDADGPFSFTHDQAGVGELLEEGSRQGSAERLAAGPAIDQRHDPVVVFRLDAANGNDDGRALAGLGSKAAATG